MHLTSFPSFYFQMWMLSKSCATSTKPRHSEAMCSAEKQLGAAAVGATTRQWRDSLATGIRLQHLRFTLGFLFAVMFLFFLPSSFNYQPPYRSISSKYATLLLSCSPLPFSFYLINLNSKGELGLGLRHPRRAGCSSTW